MDPLLWGGPIDGDGPIDVGWPYGCGVALLLWGGPIAVDGPIAVGWLDCYEMAP